MLVDNTKVWMKRIAKDTFQHQVSLVLIPSTWHRACVLVRTTRLVGCPTRRCLCAVSQPFCLQFILRYQAVFEKYFWVICGFSGSSEGCNPWCCVCPWL